MTLKTISHQFFYVSSWLVFAAIFLAANRVRIPYTPYQILVWEIKANEGYRSWWYPDGYVRSKRAYSIGFGWNDQGNRRRHEIKEFTKDGQVTFQEATQITLREIEKYGRLHSDPYKNLALQLYSYNCGLTTNPRKLGGCCGIKNRCGHRNVDVRKSHNRRRKFELALWNHNVERIIKYTKDNQDRLQKDIKFLKTRGVDVK